MNHASPAPEDLSQANTILARHHARAIATASPVALAMREYFAALHKGDAAALAQALADLRALGVTTEHLPQ